MNRHSLIWRAAGLLMALAGPGFAWAPPIGIPMPSFGVDEQAPATPIPWTSSRAGFYYVNDDVACSDTGNGYPSSPRCTVPLALPAGSVVEIHGSYGAGHTSPRIIRPAGTAASPVFIRGLPTAKPTITGAWEIIGSYAIVENLNWVTPIDAASLSMSGDHVSLRFSDLRGNLNGGGLLANGSHMVIYQNYIHDSGNLNAPDDQDVHCISVYAPTSHMWIVDNELARCSGDGTQVNGGTYANTVPATSALHHVYFGRNHSHHHKQVGFGLKQAVDVIISQNIFHSHRPGNSSNGACTNYQYGPSRVWFLNNELYDCDSGIASGSNDGPQPPAGAALGTFIIGNRIHDIHRAAGLDTSANVWKGGAAIFMSDETAPKYILNNTVYNVDAGFLNPRGSDPFYMANNILRNVATQHVNLEVPGDSTLSNTIFDSPARLIGITCAAGCQSVDPLWVNAAGNNFHLQANSPAIDAGIDISAILSEFQALYGIDISVDAECVGRPQGSGWDLGAFEYNTLGSPPACPTAPVGSSGGLPTPVLRLPPVLSVNSRITAEYPANYPVAGFIWGVVEDDAAAVQALMPKLQAMGKSLKSQSAVSIKAAGAPAVFGTTSNIADLGPQNLVPGKYVIAVVAVSNGGDFSAQAVARVTLVPADFSSVRVYPNPWRADRHPVRAITFDGLTVDTTIKIFTVSGHWVKTLPGSSTSTTWDLNTDSGDRAASGIYLYLMKAGSQKKTGQIVIIK